MFLDQDKVNKGKVTSAKSEDGVDLEKQIKTSSKGFLTSEMKGKCNKEE